ncbi:EAL domain-containing protein [Solemya velesiana gill symbiont]|uniref:EAL domain-containing protein n=1 Tax=Solemya velesiana gill symbiont TaxID=1918948 RepID=UPI001561748E|nr:EAL domain-containing protein [Solemya velesiana gill symbiont]
MGAIQQDTPPHSEILLRIFDEKGNPTSPASFIQAAEEFNRMRSVDRWVINTFFEWLKNNETLVEADDNFCINLSVQSMQDESFCSFLKEKITQSAFPPERLGFEITETAFARDISKIKHLLNEIKALGCKFLLDDFGSGYSSYSYLKKLPVDIIKIDGISVKDMLQDKSSHAMVKSITDVAHFMGKQVIAEFVENEAILIELRNLGVDYAQGYGIGQPAKIENA